MGATKRKLRPFILLFVARGRAGGRPLTTTPTTARKAIWGGPSLGGWPRLNSEKRFWTEGGGRVADRLMAGTIRVPHASVFEACGF